MNTDIIVYEKQEERGLGNWIRRHKKEILAGACIAVGTIAGILVIKKFQAGEIELPSLRFESMHSATREAVKVSISETCLEQGSVTVLEASQETIASLNAREPFDVTKHIRNLTGGRIPSEEKIRTAVDNGFVLGPNQTWVDTYTKNKAA